VIKRRATGSTSHKLTIFLAVVGVVAAVFGGTFITKYQEPEDVKGGAAVPPGHSITSDRVLLAGFIICPDGSSSTREGYCAPTKRECRPTETRVNGICTVILQCRLGQYRDGNVCRANPPRITYTPKPTYTPTPTYTPKPKSTY
jgi:hypothetical protein